MFSTTAGRLAHRAGVGLGAAAVAFAAAVVPLGAAQAADPGTKVNLVTFNDFHGALSVGDKFACTVTTARNAAESAGEESFLLSAGDNVGGSEFASAIQQDEPTLQYLNSLHVQAAAVGNHEFDQGQDDLTGRIAKHADFPYVVSNVYKADGSRFMKPWTIVDNGGVKVAVVGAVTQKTVSKVSPKAIEGLSFKDPVDEVNKAIEELKGSGEEYDLIVASYHEGADAASKDPSAPVTNGGAVFDKIVNETSADAEAIFNGDSHKAYAYNAPVPGRAGDERPVIQAGASGAWIGSVSLELGADGDWDVSTAPALTDTSVIDPASCAGDPVYEDAAAVAKKAEADSAVIGAQPVGSVTSDITTSWDVDKAKYVDGVWTKTANEKKGDNRHRHSAAGNMLADSEKWFLEEQGLAGDHEVIGFMNPGGIRAELWHAQSEGEGDGVVTYSEANDVVPFGNTLFAGDVTGAQFKQMLEEQWQRDKDGKDLEKFLAFSVSQNVTYTFDSTSPMDKRISQIFVNGKPIDPEATYTIVAASFLFDAGDGMWALSHAKNVRDTGILDRDAFSDYLKANPDLSPDYSQRQIDVKILDGGEYDSAKAIDRDPVVRFSGLESQSLGAPQIEKVVVDAGEHGTFEAPYSFDEELGIWKADVTFADWLCVPEGTKVDVKIATVPDTGTASLMTVGSFTWQKGGTPDKCEKPAPPADDDQGGDDQGSDQGGDDQGTDQGGDDQGGDDQGTDQGTDGDDAGDQGGSTGDQGADGSNGAGDSAAPAPAAPQGDLARTGAEIAPYAAAAAGLTLIGAAALVIRRRLGRR